MEAERRRFHRSTWKHRGAAAMAWMLIFALLTSPFGAPGMKAKAAPEEAGSEDTSSEEQVSGEEQAGPDVSGNDAADKTEDKADSEGTTEGEDPVEGISVISWEWNDEEGVLVWSEEAGLWGLAVPGADELNPVTPEFLEEMLPDSVTALTDAGSESVGLLWDYGDFPEEGAFEGSYVLTAEMDGEYVLAEEAGALEVLVEVGDAGMLDNKMKFLNKWYFICRDGKEITNDKDTVAKISAAIEGLDKKNPNDIIQWLKTDVLPQRIGGWVSNDLSTDPRLPELGFVEDTEKKDPFYSVGIGGDVPYKQGAKWGYFLIDEWDIPASFQDDDGDGIVIVTVKARTTPKSANGNTYQLFVNSNNPEDYKDALGNESNALKDTSTKPDILSLQVTLYNINLSDHIVPAANPANAKVNLFDYWVKTENPTVPAGDILDKSDSHLHEEGGEGVLGKDFSDYSNKDDWNLGINKGHLLLFGDGLIHAGLWNKGAGENCRYGKNYAGMEGIVKSILSDKGYPELNLSMANKILTDGSPKRDYTLIKDYKLSGDHNNSQATDQNGYLGNAYDSDKIKNLSDTAINAWGGNVNTDTESLQYLFDPTASHPNKKSFTDVKGLFQLDDKGYYYYNMRENFAEFSQDGGKHFILYDAPATTRTDGDKSIGNFFPFNKGSEVFNGMEEDGHGNKNLTSSVDCAWNSMNHHLGMTVDVEFRQPANGRVRVGGSNEPMTFEFAGDDDVWVFIDDVLVLDLGGVHSEIYGTIDFASGDVYIGRAFTTHGIPENPTDPANMVTHTTLRDLYKAAGREGDIPWSNNTFASNTSHTLKMFYLERGNYDSSIALRFNLQPLLHQQLMKVDQNGEPLPGVEFALHPAEVTDDTGAIRCLYTDGNQNGETFYVKPDDSETLVTLTTESDGSAVFATADGSYFNFADRGDRYYVLRETTAPNGYRKQPIDIVLHYDTSTSMLSVANRWTTGAYACSVSNVTSVGRLRYGQLVGEEVKPTGGLVQEEEQEKGLVVAVPLLQKQSDHSWLALYGSNMGGFGSVPAGSGESAWQSAVLRAALEQANAGNTSGWHLEWDEENKRLSGRLSDLPGLASRYKINNPNGDMSMVYAIISPEALDALGINEATYEKRYKKLREYLETHTTADAMNAVQGTADGFHFLSIEQFNREFRSLIYIPNERRELWVMKVDQDGKPLRNTKFGLYTDEACTQEAASGTTDVDGRLIFSPNGNDTEGYAKMVWTANTNTEYYLKEISAPVGYNLNPTVVPVIVGTYSIYADAGTSENGISVMAGVGRLTQTMRQYAMDSDVDITLQDITAFMQMQPSGTFQLTGWQDAKLEGTNIVRSMNLHFGKNAEVDYGLHDEDGGKLYKPFFVTDSGFIRARVQQNYAALMGGMYEGARPDANKDNLGETDLTNLFSLLNIVVVTDRIDAEIRTGKLTIGKKLTGSGLTDPDYTKNFMFAVEFKDADGNPLPGRYYFYGDNKVGYVGNGDNLVLHHDEAVTILGLPEGTKYTITEVAENGWHVTPESGVYTGEIRKDETIELRYTNSKDPKKPEDPPGDTPDDPDSPGGDTPRKPPLPPGNMDGPDPQMAGGILTGSPDTGDNSLPGFWILIACVFLARMFYIYFREQRAR